MARQINKLTAKTVSSLSEPGRHGDGNGLYLVIDKAKNQESVGAKRWVYLFRWGGSGGKSKLREMGLGGASDVTLARARELAAAARAKVHAGIDPIAARKVEPEKTFTFGEMADEFIKAMKPQFRNAKHIAQWEMTLKEYAADIRALAVDKVTTDDVLKVLKPIWSEKPETASRLRGRIERVLDAAKAKGLRQGENPALWRGHLSNLLPKRQKLTRGHHAAMDYRDVPAFVLKLRQRDAVSARALEFTILTAARSGETFGATWAEIDRERKLWTVPAARMKAGRDHRVPLTPAAMTVVKQMAAFGSDPAAYVFPGAKRGRPLSVMAMDMILRRMDVDVTVHGFRSSFRDWCGEETLFPREIAEAALAHVVGDMTERAYRRGDALEKRRALMEEWAKYCDQLRIFS